MKSIWLMPIVLGSMALGAAVSGGFNEKPTILPRADSGDIASLVDRMQPFIENADAPYEYSNGISVTFVGRAFVKVRLKMKNGDEYSGTAPSLRGAVARITRPSEEIKKAMEGWAPLP